MKRPRPTLAQVDELHQEIARHQALVDSFEAANIERQGKIESLQKQLQEQLDVNSKIRGQLREAESRLHKHEITSKRAGDTKVVDYSLVDTEKLAEFALAVLTYEETVESILRNEIDEAATFHPHAQQQIVLDEHGCKRFRKNQLVDRLVNEACDDRLTGLNYVATIEASREDRAQLAQLIGYSVDGYHSLDYALPVKEEDE